MPAAGITVIVEIVADDKGRWLVRVFKNTYGEYADKRAARGDALQAAKDAQLLGYENVEVWDRSTRKRLL